MVVPAVGIDLVRLWIGAGRSWGRDALIVLLSAAVFVGLFSVTQWFFAKLLLSEHGQNWFFAADRHWGYTEALADWRAKFWDKTGSTDEPTATARTFAIALLCAFISSGVGLLLGNWMSKVRR
jgi:hypothetical protein